VGIGFVEPDLDPTSSIVQAVGALFADSRLGHTKNDQQEIYLQPLSITGFGQQPPPSTFFCTMLTVDDLNPAVLNVQYAVRGELAIKAEEFREALKDPKYLVVVAILQGRVVQHRKPSAKGPRSATYHLSADRSVFPSLSILQ
jgi:hypothetical protein